NAPYLTVFLSSEDTAPPAAPADLRAETAGLPAGEAWLSWATPADSGPAGAAGVFFCGAGKEEARFPLPARGAARRAVRVRAGGGGTGAGGGGWGWRWG